MTGKKKAETEKELRSLIDRKYKSMLKGEAADEEEPAKEKEPAAKKSKEKEEESE